MSKELADAIIELRNEIRSMNRRGGGGGGGGGGGAGSGSGLGSRIRSGASAATQKFGSDLKSLASETKDPFRPMDAIDPRVQANRLMTEGKKFEELNRRMFEAGGANIRDMYGEIARNGRTIFDEVGSQTRKYFGDTEAGLKSMEAMFRGLGQMEIIGNDQRKSIALTTAALGKLGMPVEDTVGIVDTLNNAFGMNAEEAASMAKGVYDLSMSLQLPPSLLAKEFRSAQRDLAYSADKIGKVFTGLQKKSRITGISYDNLMKSVGSGMDTFEGAAKSAGGLNAVLGGPYLNSMELLTATEDERVQMLQDAFAESGKNVDELGKFELQSLAEQLNMNPEDARRLLRGDATREELSAKIEERMDEAGTAEGLRMKGGQEGLDELTDNFKAMIPPLESAQIAFQNIGENLLRAIIPGDMKNQELYRFRDAAGAAALNLATGGEGGRDGGEATVAGRIGVDIEKEGAAVIAKMATESMKRIQDDLYKVIEARAKEELGISLPDIDLPTKKPTPGGESDTGTTSPGQKRSEKNIFEKILEEVQKGMSGEIPINLSLKLNSSDITTLQGILIKDPTGGSTA